MKTLDRMILKQIMAPFGGALLTFMVIMLLDRMFDLMDLLIRKGVSVAMVGLVVGYTLPFIFAFTAPMAVLVAVLVAFGRMAQDSEIMAAKALGISTRRMTVGPFVGVAGLTLFLFWFNNEVVPEANHRLRNLIFEINHKRPTAQIKKGLFTQIEDYLVYVEDKNDRTSEIFNVKIQETGSHEPRTILAEKGRVYVIGDTVMIFALRNGQMHQATGRRREGYRWMRFRSYSMKIPINPELITKERKFRSDREKPLGLLVKDIEKKQRDIRTRRLDAPARKSLRARLSQLWVELHKRFALPLAGLIFVLVGVPIAAMTKRGGYGTAFGVSFFVFVLYYIILMGGEQLSERGMLPHPVIWVPNLLFLIIAFWLMRKEEKK